MILGPSVRESANDERSWPLPMRFLSVLFLVAAGAVPAFAQPVDKPWNGCLVNALGNADVISDCTAVLTSGQGTSEQRAIAFNNRGVGRTNAGDENTQKAAIRDFDEAIKLNPKVAKFFYNRGYARTGTDNVSAIADYGTAIGMDPLFAVAWGQRAESYLQLKKWDEAIRDASEAIRLAPHYLHSLYNPYETRALAKEGKGDTKGAEAERAGYMEINKPVIGPNTSGNRSWEGYMRI